MVLGTIGCTRAPAPTSAVRARFTEKRARKKKGTGQTQGQIGDARDDAREAQIREYDDNVGEREMEEKPGRKVRTGQGKGEVV